MNPPPRRPALKRQQTTTIVKDKLKSFGSKVVNSVVRMGVRMNVLDSDDINLGITPEGLEEVCREIYFKVHGSVADGYTNMYVRPPELAWVTEKHGAEMSGYDLVYALQAWLREQGEQDESVCSLLLKRGGTWAKHVGRATCYYSHRRVRPLARTLGCMRRFTQLHAAELPASYGEPVFFWIGYASVELCHMAGSLEPATIVATVRSMPMTALELDGSPGDFLSRAVCLLVAYAAIGAADEEAAETAETAPAPAHAAGTGGATTTTGQGQGQGQGTPRGGGGGVSSGRLRVYLDPLRAAQVLLPPPLPPHPPLPPCTFRCCCPSLKALMPAPAAAARGADRRESAGALGRDHRGRRVRLRGPGRVRRVRGRQRARRLRGAWRAGGAGGGRRGVARVVRRFPSAWSQNRRCALPSSGV